MILPPKRYWVNTKAIGFTLLDNVKDCVWVVVHGLSSARILKRTSSMSQEDMMPLYNMETISTWQIFTSSLPIPTIKTANMPYVSRYAILNVPFLESFPSHHKGGIYAVHNPFRELPLDSLESSTMQMVTVVLVVEKLAPKNKNHPNGEGGR